MFTGLPTKDKTMQKKKNNLFSNPNFFVNKIEEEQ